MKYCVLLKLVPCKMEDDKILTIVSAVLSICLVISEWLGVSKCTESNSILQVLVGLIKRGKLGEEEEERKVNKIVRFE